MGGSLVELAVFAGLSFAAMLFSVCRDLMNGKSENLPKYGFRFFATLFGLFVMLAIFGFVRNL